MKSILKISIFNISISNLLRTVTSFIIWGYGGYNVIQGNMSLGELSAFNMYSTRFILPIIRLAEMNLNFKETKESVNRVYDILCENEGEMNIFYNLENRNESKIDLSKRDINLEFRNVSFSYVDGQEVLTDVNLMIPHGKMI